MTREEAMDIFEHNWTRLVNADYTEEELNKAIDMAIKALEQDIDFDKQAEEIIKETVESIWGKPPYTEVLDSIKADVEKYQADCDLSCSDDANCRICDKITFDTIYRIIDKYRKGQTDADSD